MLVHRPRSWVMDKRAHSCAYLEQYHGCTALQGFERLRVLVQTEVHVKLVLYMAKWIVARVDDREDILHRI